METNDAAQVVLKQTQGPTRVHKLFRASPVNMLLARRIIASPPKKLSSLISDSIYNRPDCVLQCMRVFSFQPLQASLSATAAQRCVRGRIYGLDPMYKGVHNDTSVLVLRMVR